MDPIVTDDETTNAAHQKIASLVRGIDENISIHDFRMVTGPTKFIASLKMTRSHPVIYYTSFFIQN